MSIRETKTHRSHKYRQLQIILTVTSIANNKNLIMVRVINIPAPMLVVVRKSTRQIPISEVSYL